MNGLSADGSDGTGRIVLLRDHSKDCPAVAIRTGDSGTKVRELSEAVQRFVSS